MIIIGSGAAWAAWQLSGCAMPSTIEGMVKSPGQIRVPATTVQLLAKGALGDPEQVRLYRKA